MRVTTHRERDCTSCSFKSCVARWSWSRYYPWWLPASAPTRPALTTPCAATQRAPPTEPKNPCAPSSDCDAAPSVVTMRPVTVLHHLPLSSAGQLSERRYTDRLPRAWQIRLLQAARQAVRRMPTSDRHAVHRGRLRTPRRDIPRGNVVALPRLAPLRPATRGMHHRTLLPVVQRQVLRAA